MRVRHKCLVVLWSCLFLSCENKVADSIDLSAHIGPQIRAIRLERGMTQEALASVIGIDQNALSLIEDGMATPIHSKLIDIETYFDTIFKIEGERIKIKAYLSKKLK